MKGKVEVRVKDQGHSITIEGQELRGTKMIVVEESDYISRLRRSGLITTKPYQEAEKPVVKEVPNVVDETANPTDVAQETSGPRNQQPRRNRNRNRHNGGRNVMDA